jgi:hypothetical protein
MAVHIPSIHLILEAIVNEPDFFPNDSLYAIPIPTIGGYDMTATGVADRVTIWQGDDPFAPPEPTRNAFEPVTVSSSDTIVTNSTHAALGLPSSRSPE